MSIHQKIREGRKRLGMTEQQFADAIGVSRSAVHQWEMEGGTAPKRSHQPAVARLMGITVSELMGGGASVATSPAQPAATSDAAASAPSLEQALTALSAHLANADLATRETAAVLLAELARKPAMLESVCKALGAMLPAEPPTANRKAA